MSVEESLQIREFLRQSQHVIDTRELLGECSQQAVDFNGPVWEVGSQVVLDR